jgi:hypothetical protein
MLNDTITKNRKYDLIIDKLTYNATDGKHTQLYNNSADNTIYIYGILPADLIPAAYLQFRYDNLEENFNRLTDNNTLPDSYYSSVFEKYEDKEKIKEEFKKKLEGLNDFKNVDLTVFTGFTCILWFCILLFLMKMIYHYYKNIYTYIIVILIIMLLAFAIIWKIMYTLQ